MATAKIYINDENTAAIDAIVTRLNGRVKRSVDTAWVMEAVEYAEGVLDRLGVPQRERVGTRVRVNPSENRQPSANAYKYHANATEVVIVKNTVGWYVDENASGVMGALSGYRDTDYIIVLPAKAYD